MLSMPSTGLGGGAVSKRVTLADVAALAGMSTTAVSLVLNNRPGSRLSEEAADRIRAAAEELGYRPNPAARSLRMGKTRTVGFLSDDVTVTRFASAMIRGALDVADARGYQVLISETGHDPAKFKRGLDAVLDRRPDALIVGLMGAKEIDVPDVVRGRIPVVLVNASTPGPYHCVLPAEFEAGRSVAHHLVERGHRRICLIGDDPVLRTDKRISATIGARFDGIETALAEQGLELTGTIPRSVWEPEDGYSALEELLRQGPEATAVIAANDRIAMGIYQAAGDLGLKIPEDLSVISFDDEFLATYLRPKLTSARIPYEQMGRRAMELVLSGTPTPGQTLLEMPLQVRGSVARRD